MLFIFNEFGGKIKMAHKLCPACGTIFQVKEDNAFCSRKCKELFSRSSLEHLKNSDSGKKRF